MTIKSDHRRIFADLILLAAGASVQFYQFYLLQLSSSGRISPFALFHYLPNFFWLSIAMTVASLSIQLLKKPRPFHWSSLTIFTGLMVFTAWRSVYIFCEAAAAV